GLGLGNAHIGPPRVLFPRIGVSPCKGEGWDLFGLAATDQLSCRVRSPALRARPASSSSLVPCFERARPCYAWRDSNPSPQLPKRSTGYVKSGFRALQNPMQLAPIFMS